MASRRPHSRRLSLSFFGSANNQPSAIVFPSPHEASKLDSTSKAASENPKKSTHSLGRKLSKKRRPTKDTLSPQTDPPPSAFSYSDANLPNTALECDTQSSRSIKRKRSLNLRVALSSIFVPKPSPRKVIGILDGMQGISGGKVLDDRRRKDPVDMYGLDSRSPSPPSPEIRPPSGLGTIDNSVDLSTYAQEDYEASILKSSLSRSPRTASRPVSIVPSMFFEPTEDDMITEADAVSLVQQGHTRSTTTTTNGTQPDFGLLQYFPTIPLSEPLPPSTALIDVCSLAMPYCPQSAVAAVARISRALLHPARLALYAEINSDDLSTSVEDESRVRRSILKTIASVSEVARLVRRMRWVCLSLPASPLPPTTSRTIPRRTPTISIGSSPEEYLLPRVLGLVPNLESLELVQPPSSLLQIFVPVRRSPRASPVSPSPVLIPHLTSLKSLTLSGRTTLSSNFGAVLIRFLELHPGITDLRLPDVFHLDVHSASISLARKASKSSSPISSPQDSPSPTSDVPPVPPLPSSLAQKSPNIPIREQPLLLPNLAFLRAPLTLVTQLVPGRPLRKVDIEVSTSLYEGLRPAELAKALSEGSKNDKPAERLHLSPPPVDWRTARQARRAGKSPISPTFATLSEGTPSIANTPPASPVPKWKAAREARRSGVSPTVAKFVTSDIRDEMERGFDSLGKGRERSPSTEGSSERRGKPSLIVELRLRCTAKVDARTLDKLLNALAGELGTSLEKLAVGWAGRSLVLHQQLSLLLCRFTNLKSLELFSTSSESDTEDGEHDASNENSIARRKSMADFQAALALERQFVEQWSRACPRLCYMEFASQRVWKATSS